MKTLSPFWQVVLNAYRGRKKTLGAKLAREDVQRTLTDMRWNRMLELNPALKERVKLGERRLRKREIALRLIEMKKYFNPDTDIEVVMGLAEVCLKSEEANEAKAEVK